MESLAYWAFAAFIAAVVGLIAWLAVRDAQNDADPFAELDRGMRETIENDYRRSGE